MLVTPDFSETSADLTPGNYSARVTACEPQVSKKAAEAGQSAPNMLKVTYEIFGSEEKGQNGQTVNDYVMFTGKAAGKYKDFHRATMKEEAKAGVAFDSEMYCGKEVKVTLAQRPPQPDGTPSKFVEVKTVTGI